MDKSNSQTASITRNLHTYLDKLSVIKEKKNVKTQNLIYCSTKSAEGTVDGLFPSPSSPCIYPLFFITEPLLSLISDTVFFFSVASGSLSLYWVITKKTEGLNSIQASIQTCPDFSEFYIRLYIQHWAVSQFSACILPLPAILNLKIMSSNASEFHVDVSTPTVGGCGMLET